ncbi:MAG: hypothetical protein PHH58_11690, partial [Rhodoferax sp.]|nr:hypothetical protein [Rhodoferax sp.]
TQVAMDTSRARLKEQPAKWFTLALGTWPLATPLATLEGLPTDWPVFVLPLGTDQLQVFYGVFPSRKAAQRAGAANQANVVSIGSLKN